MTNVLLMLCRTCCCKIDKNNEFSVFSGVFLDQEMGLKCDTEIPLNEMIFDLCGIRVR